MTEYEDIDLLSETERIFLCIILVVILAFTYGSASIYIRQNPTEDTGYFIFLSKEEKMRVEKDNAIYNYALGYIDGYERYQSNKQEAEQAQIKNTTLAESRAVLGFSAGVKHGV